MGFYITCPYFMHQQHKRPTISCEDCVRLFESNEEKFDYIKKYCEEDWKACPFAVRLNEIYERTINMSDKDSRVYVAEKELAESREYNKKLLSDIGRKNKHIERLEGTIADMNEIARQNHEQYREELQALRTRSGNLEKQKQWAESVLAAVLIKNSKMSDTIRLDMKELGELMVKYQLRFEMDEENMIATAKITRINKEEK